MELRRPTGRDLRRPAQPRRHPITRFQELSGLLGADLKSRANTDAQAAFDRAALPAVRAGQVAYWPWKTYSHRSYARALNDLTEVVRKARPDIV